MGYRLSCCLFVAVGVLAPGCAGPSHPVFTMPSHDPHPGFRCQGHQNIVLRDVTIEARGDGVRAGQYCHVTIHDSEIYGTRFGVATTQYSSITLVNTIVEGGRGWAFASGYSNVTSQGGVTVGPIRVGQNGRVLTDDKSAHVD